MHTSRVTQQDTAPSGRRRFLERLIVVVQTTIGGTLGVVLGGAVLSPGLARRAERWLSAGKVADLVPNTPTAVMLRVARQDGYAQVVERRTVFLVRTDDSTVTAIDSTCTHLGCRVSWNPGTKELVCPCHGGRYDSNGAVKSGPPPAPLATFDTKISDGDVLVRV
jgi:Rieske Fe-S protein